MSDPEPIPVLYVVLASYVGGAEEYVARLAAALERPFAPVVGASDPVVRATLARRLSGTRVTVVELPRPAPGDARSWLRFVAAVRRAGAPLVHVNVPSLDDRGGRLAAILARRAGARVVVTVHLAAIPWSWRRRAETALASRAVARTLTVCEANRAALAARGVDPARIAVVLNATPPAEETASARIRRELHLTDEDVLVLTVGALEERKDPLGLLAAFGEAAAREPRLVLAFAGAGPLEGAVTRDAASGHGRVHVLGRRDDVGALLEAADVVVLVSKLEGLPLAVLEAMAAGRPVVAAAVDGVPEAVVDGETGLLVPPGDRTALAAAIVRLGRDPDVRRRMGEAGRARARERFTLERMARETAAVYRDVLGLAAA